MKAKRRQLEAIKRKIRHGHGRSSLFVWMVENQADLMTKDRAGRMPWIDLCADFVELGLRDGEGKLPTPKRAGATWRAVCAEVEAQAKRAASDKLAAPQSHRSRQQDWQPAVTRTEQPVGRRAPPPPPPKAPAQGPYDHLPEHVKAQLTAVDEQLAYLDRHIIRPKQRN